MNALRVLHAPLDCLHCQYRTTRLFCNLSKPALAEYDAIGTSITVSHGEILFREGEASDKVLVLCTGSVKLSCTSQDGKTLNLRIALPGDVLGLSGAISGNPFELTAETLELSVLKLIRRVPFLLFLERQGEASLHAARALSGEYQAAFQKARILALSGSVAERLAGLLLDWARASAEGRVDLRFNMALTHDDLASFTGSSRETITRTMGKFQRDKLISVHGASIHILAPERLAILAA